MSHYQHDVRAGLIEPKHTRTTATLEEAFWAKVKHAANGCRIWTGANKGGPHPYGKVWYRGRLAGKAHHLAWEFVNGPIPEGLNVLHRCDRPLCVYADPDPEVSHLFLGSIADNTADMIAKGRAIWQQEGTAAYARWLKALQEAPRVAPCGEASPMAKLTDAKVREILRRRASGEQLLSIAADFGVSISTISRVASHERWAHVIAEGIATAA